MQSDAEAVIKARGGSARAFAALMNQHQGVVRSFAHRISADAGEAEDLAQEAFVHAWEKLDTLDSPESFRSWVLGITWRKAQTRARSHNRRRARDSAWLEGQSQSIDAVGEAVLTAAQLFQKLSPDQRAVLALCHGEGWSQAEAADILGLPLGTVKSHMTRAKARLRELTGVSDE